VRCSPIYDLIKFRGWPANFELGLAAERGRMRSWTTHKEFTRRRPSNVDRTTGTPSGRQPYREGCTKLSLTRRRRFHMARLLYIIFSRSPHCGSRKIARHLRNELDLFQLQVLDTLLRDQSLTRAAEALNMTQPALSKTLARLREHFDDPLFVRVGFQMKPTTKALGLAGQIKNILKEVSLLKSEQLPFSPEVSSRHFKFAGPDVAAVVLLPPILKQMRVRAPDARLSAVQLDAEHLHGWLESGEVDLAAGDYPFLVQGIKRQRLFITNHVSLVRKCHPRIAELTSLDAFADEHHVLVSTLDMRHATRAAEDALEQAIPKKRVAARVPGFAAAAVLAKYTEAIVTLPKPIAIMMARELNLDIFQTPVKLPDTEVYQYWHERYDRDPGHEWLRALFRDECTRFESA
jgi:DNA-binding transcriptional LysR family regulator